jgi:DNA polymerase III alpha subunit
LPKGHDANAYLRWLCERAFAQQEWDDEQEARQRLEQELALACQHGLASYFLAVREITEELRRRRWPWALRGSAGSSLICFLLSFSQVNPLRHGLRVERFLHAGRISPPDIDLDVATHLLEPLLAWLVRHFGEARVARVGRVEAVSKLRHTPTSRHGPFDTPSTP